MAGKDDRDTSRGDHSLVHTEDPLLLISLTRGSRRLLLLDRSRDAATKGSQAPHLGSLCAAWASHMSPELR